MHHNNFADPFRSLPISLGSGITYRGDTRDGALHGNGILQTPGGTYDGAFVNNLKHGWGRFTSSTAANATQPSTGTVLLEYEGEWHLDQPSGKCLAAVFRAAPRASGSGNVTPLFEYYGGMCVNGRPHGEGKLTYKDGKTYSGEFSSGQRHGRGSLQQCNGDLYEGEFEAGKYHGEGRETTMNGARTFAGTFRHNRRDRGKMIFGDLQGKWYDGEWQQDRPHGRGTQKQPNGDLYTGWFAEGKFSGYGEFYYADTGATFRGPFRDGLPHGEGTIDIPRKKANFPATFTNGRLDPQSAELYRQKVTTPSSGSAKVKGPSQPQSDALTFDSDEDGDDILGGAPPALAVPTTDQQRLSLSNSLLSVSAREFTIADDDYGATTLRAVQQQHQQQQRAAAQDAADALWHQTVAQEELRGRLQATTTPPDKTLVPQTPHQEMQRAVQDRRRLDAAAREQEEASRAVDQAKRERQRIIDAAEQKHRDEEAQANAKALRQRQKADEAVAASKRQQEEAAAAAQAAVAAADLQERQREFVEKARQQQRADIAATEAARRRQDAERRQLALEQQQQQQRQQQQRQEEDDAQSKRDYAARQQQNERDAAIAAQQQKKAAELEARKQQEEVTVKQREQQEALTAAAAAAASAEKVKAAAAVAAEASSKAAAAASADAKRRGDAAAKRQAEVAAAAAAAKKLEADAALVGQLSDPKTVSFANGDVYDGCVGTVSKKPEGRGHYTFTDGREYDGDFHLGLRHGQGKLASPNGDVYEGGFVDGKQHGKGHAISMNGTRKFDGVFHQGRRVDGKMQFLDQTGKWYEGPWQDEKPHGYGVQRQANGDVYTGEFVAGRYHGAGEMDYASDHRVLKGNFEADKPRGPCVVSYQDGKVMELTYDASTGALIDKKVLKESPAAVAAAASAKAEREAAAKQQQLERDQANKGPSAEELAALSRTMVKSGKPGEVPVVTSGDKRCPTPDPLKADRYRTTPNVVPSIPSVAPFRPKPPAEYLPDETQEGLNEVIRNDAEMRLRGKSRMEAESEMEEETWATVQDQLDLEEESGKPAVAAGIIIADGFYKKYNFSKTSIYTGFLKNNGQREGPAKYACTSFVYQGVFRNDKRCGYGVLKAHPQSTAQIKLYQGLWVDDTKEDTLAHATIAGGDVYVGGFQKNVFHGTGKYQYADGKVYEGQYHQGQRHGKGRLVFTNGDVYEGGFVKGAMTGSCVWTTQQKSRVFVGTVLDGKKQSGRIVFHDQGGKCFDGAFLNEKPHGRGAMLLSNGDVYRGDLDQGVFHGQGVLYYLSDNKSYVGAFVDGKPHGVGTLRNHTDPTLHAAGEWVGGKRVTTTA